MPWKNNHESGSNCLHFKQCQGLGFIDSSHPHQSGGFTPHSSTILHTCSKYSSKASIVTGAGVLEDFSRAIDAGADALLAASVFHFGVYRISQVKDFLRSAGYLIR
jgi:hypothetical protein